MFQNCPFIDGFSRFILVNLSVKTRFRIFWYINGENRENGRNISGRGKFKLIQNAL